MDEIGQVPSTAVRWRVLGDGLWAARLQGRHLGTVERGHRFVASDADSSVLGAFRTFGEAQRAVVGRVSGPAPSGPGAGLVVATCLFVCALGGVLAVMRPVLGV